MFPFNQGHELVFQIHPFQEQQQQQFETTQQDLQLNSLDDTVPRTSNTPRSRLKKSLMNTEENNKDETGHVNKQKKVMHREIERLRRQEMGKLYGKLRSLLPLEFIKGKRSISDHMNQAVNYINHLQGNIKELEIKKNGLKKTFDKSGTIIGSSNYDMSSNDGNIVTVTQCWCGAEILVSSRVLMEEGSIFPLSRVMQLLLYQGLTVISCASVRVNDRLLHTIQTEAVDPTCIDVSGLQEKLNNLIHGSWDINRRHNMIILSSQVRL